MKPTRFVTVALSLLILAAPAPHSVAAQDDAGHLFVQANVQLDGGHFVEAVAGFDKCLAADPKMLKALFNRAIANEMVDRAKAIADWKSFAAAAGNDPELKYLAARALARVQILEGLPPLPPGLEPSRLGADVGEGAQDAGLLLREVGGMLKGKGGLKKGEPLGWFGKWGWGTETKSPGPVTTYGSAPEFGL